MIKETVIDKSEWQCKTSNENKTLWILFKVGKKRLQTGNGIEGSELKKKQAVVGWRGARIPESSNKGRCGEGFKRQG